MRSAMASFLFLFMWAAPLGAQELDAGPNNLGRFDVAVAGGALNGAEDLGWQTRMQRAPAFGASFTYWTEPWFGLRARALYSNEMEIRTIISTLAEQEPSALLMLGDLLLRRPYEAAGTVLLPYVSGSIGVKRYGFDDGGDAYHGFAGGLGGGLEMRVGRIGIFGEGSHIFSQFATRGFKQGTRDWVYVAGLSLGLDRGGPTALTLR